MPKNLSNICDTMWTVFIHKHLIALLRSLKNNITRMRKSCPEKLKGHPLVHLYVALVKVMGQVQADPTQDKYLLGNTLGKNHRGWRRVKKGLPQRYRLFFKFFSSTHEIFFVWLNDERTLRNKKAKSDCYAVFRRMLERGDVPSERKALIADSVEQKES